MVARSRFLHIITASASVLAISATAIAGLGPVATAAAAAPTIGASISPAEASMLARQTSTAVEATALTTPTELTIANPDGTLTVSSATRPQRVRTQTGWKTVDATLIRNADGSLSPAAATGGLRISNGGTTSLAMMDRQGHTLSIGFPMVLPAPAVAGATVTYPEVYPGVDLQLTANESGGFSEILVVKTPEAAANPALTSLRFSVASPDLTVSSSVDGVLRAADKTGRAYFSAPTALMWDSSAPGAVARTVTPATAGAGASVAIVPASVDSSAYTIAPDRAYLTNSARIFPILIDPTWNNGSTAPAFDEIQSGCPGVSNYNSTTYSDPGAGLNTFSGCTGKEQSFFQFGFPSGAWSAHVTSAYVTLVENYSASCSSAKASLINVYPTTSISTATTWNNPPVKISAYAGTDVHNSYGPVGSKHCGLVDTQTRNFPMTPYVQAQATARSGAATFGVYGDESSSDYLRRFSPLAVMVVTYNHAPATPTLLGTTPTPVNGNATDLCGVSTPYGSIGNAQVTFKANVLDADGGVVTVNFSVTSSLPYGIHNLSVVKTLSAGASTATVTTAQTLASGSYA